MIEAIKEMLIQSPDAIATLLKQNGFAHIALHTNEIRFARSEDGGPNIRIKLENNNNVTVTDFVLNVSKDIIAYIMLERGLSFPDVIKQIKNILGINDNSFSYLPKRKGLFGDVYKNVRSKVKEELTIYPESMLDQYQQYGNSLWLKDNISLESQRFWGVRYCVESQRIILPVRSESGELCGIKGRLNGDTEDGEPKYLYMVPTTASLTLFGYSDNYAHMYGKSVIVTESEKSNLQAYTYGNRSCVGLGGSLISERQAKLIMMTQPKEIIVATDKGLDKRCMDRNINTMIAFCKLTDTKIYVWEPGDDIPDKSSPTDNGKQEFEAMLYGRKYLKQVK